MNFNFGEVLTRAWQITWKYKVLWIFGILAGCAQGGGGGGGNSGYRSGNNPNLPQNYQQMLDRFSNWIVDQWWIILVIVLVLFLIVALFIFLGTIGRIGLIRGTLQAEEGAQSMSFGPLFSGSQPYFWRVFGLGLVVGLGFFILFFTLIMGGLITAGIGFICLLPIICLLIPISIVVNIIMEQAFVAIVKENLGLVDGWKRGWEVARANMGPVLIMALILFALSFFIGLIIAIPILAVVVPAAIAFAAGNGQDFTPMLLTGLCVVAYLPVAILLRGVLATFSGSAWTLTYLRLTQAPPVTPPALIEANA